MAKSMPCPKCKYFLTIEPNEYEPTLGCGFCLKCGTSVTVEYDQIGNNPINLLGDLIEKPKGGDEEK